MNGWVKNADQVFQVADSTGNRGEGVLCFELFGFVFPAVLVAARMLRQRATLILNHSNHRSSGEFSRTLLRTQLTIESLPSSVFLPIGARPAILQVDSP